jgi:hypothetical protein
MLFRFSQSVELSPDLMTREKAAALAIELGERKQNGRAIV